MSLFKPNQSRSVEQANLNDFQHKVERLIRDHQGDSHFPLLDAFMLAQDELDDYLFERQAIIDSQGTERTRYTVAGLLIALPVIIISAFPDESLPWGEWSLFVAVAIGIALYLVYYVIQKLVVRARISRLNSSLPNAKEYVDAVLKFES